MKKTIYILLFLILSLSLYGQSSVEKLIKEGVSFHDKGEYVKAITCYQQALKENPSSISAIYEMSLSFLKMKDYDNAIKYSTQVINVGFKPLLVDAYVVKGTALAAQDKLEEATVLFTEAISKCESEYLLHYNLGLCYYNKKNSNLALINLRKALELDKTHASAFLLYAYVLNDAGKWVQSFYSFQFFLLLEPNTHRSKEAFREMYNLISIKLPSNSPQLKPEDGLDRQILYEEILKHKPQSTDKEAQYQYFVAATKEIFNRLSLLKLPSSKGMLWEFFVPVFQEILESGHFETYCRYVSVAYFQESFNWWENNKEEVDNFIEWFEHGESPDAHADEYSEEGGEGEEYIEGDDE